ncbi:MAG: SurA N-terminal domain-containing protein [Omnitrophica bacterium]|nr:SurA N-terminal domain-containing protein [Candidatus Omnitrophota bacterium]
MKHMKEIAKYRSFSAMILAALLFLPGCGSQEKEETTSVATVNGKPIYLKELRREISNRVRQDPTLEVDGKMLDDLVDNLIKRQLIIQEAMDKKMAEEQGFVDTIKAFWEQTLIRDFVNRKNEELDRYVFVTDGEVELYYKSITGKNSNLPPLEEIHDRVKEAITRRKKAEKLESWLEEKKMGSEIQINKKLIAKEVVK